MKKSTKEDLKALSLASFVVFITICVGFSLVSATCYFLGIDTKTKPKAALSYEGSKLIHSMKKLEGWHKDWNDGEQWLKFQDKVWISPEGVVCDSDEIGGYRFDKKRPAAFEKDAPYIKEAYQDLMRRLATSITE